MTAPIQAALRPLIAVGLGAALPCLALASDAALSLPDRLAAAEARAAWVAPLAALSMLLLLLVLWLVWRLSVARRVATQPAHEAVAVPRALPLAVAAGLPAPVRPAEPDGAPPEAQAVDVDQQVDFFELLGQHEAAVAVLSAHIAGPGGDDAPSYLKLMQIHRRYSDPQAFEQVRLRYRQHFDAEAPVWLSPPSRRVDVDLLLPIGDEPAPAIDLDLDLDLDLAIEVDLDLDLSEPTTRRLTRL